MSRTRFMPLVALRAATRWPAGSAVIPVVATPGLAAPVASPPVIRPPVIRPPVIRPWGARPRLRPPQVTKSGTPARARARAGATPGAGPPAIPCLGLSISLATGQTERLADSIVDRVLSCGGPVGTVVLDVGSASGIDADSHTALLALHHRLRILGTQLRIATASHQLASRLGQAGGPGHVAGPGEAAGPGQAGGPGHVAGPGEAGLPAYLSPDAIHDSFRSAVLAAYAALPGPGLVTAQVRAALDTPLEPVDG
jgi:hypothetical protein